MTNTHTNSTDATERVPASEPAGSDRRPQLTPRRSILVGIAVIPVIAAILAVLAVRRDDGHGGWQTADVGGPT